MFGWRYRFVAYAWPDVRQRLEAVAWTDNEAGYLFDVIDSVLEYGAEDLLALTTSMHDLVVAPHPLPEPPIDVVLVAAPNSLRHHPRGTVRIDHIGVHGENTEIIRPASEAVALFWRFLQIEFGIARTGRTG